jgi:haloacetate dehalogenase
MAEATSLGYWPWFLFAQPAPFPEQLIAAAPDHFLRFSFRSWAQDPSVIDERAFALYLDALTDSTAMGICGDFRASFWLDQQDDAADRDAGRRITCPVLVVTGAAETQLADAPEVWRRWAADVRAIDVPGGHFIPEEAPERLLRALTPFLADVQH